MAMSVLNKFIEKIDVTNSSNSPFNDFAVRLIGLIEKTELQKISDYSADHYQQLMASILPVLTTLE